MIRIFLVVVAAGLVIIGATVVFFGVYPPSTFSTACGDGLGGYTPRYTTAAPIITSPAATTTRKMRIIVFSTDSCPRIRCAILARSAAGVLAFRAMTRNTALRKPSAA